MTKIRIAINGFGRIGRMVFRQMIDHDPLEIVAINASYPPETLAHLLKYDSVHGPFTGDVKAVEDGLVINGSKIRLFQSRNPLKLPWEAYGIDIIIEATGQFTSKEKAHLHVKAGAKKVIVTAPGENIDQTIVMGVNEQMYNPETDIIISNASCTTNCLAPVVKVIDQYFGIVNGVMTTVHSFTTDQVNLDNPHHDLRRARGCMQSIIPTSTGAAQAIDSVLPHLKGKLHGLALRIPTPNVSLIDLVVDVEKSVTAESVNDKFQQVSKGELKDILAYNEEPLVSIDYVTTDHSAIIDGLSTMVIDERKIKVLAWYDNEWGYSRRIIDLAHYIGKFL